LQLGEAGHTIDSKVASKKAFSYIKTALQSGRTSLLEFEAEEIAKQYGIPVPKSGLASSETQAVRIAKQIGYPVVMKIASPDILHKTDAGGVLVNVSSNAELKSGFRQILRNARRVSKSAKIMGIYIQKMESITNEFVVGGIRDHQFGPCVMFGLGGIYVELYKDVQFRLAPLTVDGALEMMRGIKAAQLLTGYRGSKGLDIREGARVIHEVGEMLTDLEEIESIDINPLLINEKGCKALDVRVILNK
jgi:succinyl-CoA synthetase beta subunit